jgi:hypothetical protein
MATFAEICAEVYTLTSRPDLVDQTKAAVRAATLKAHQSDFYYKDLYEVGVSFSTADYVQSLEYKLLVPRYRALKYIRKTDVNGVDTDRFLQILTPEETVDSYGINKEDIAYVAGQVIQIRSSTELQYAFLGCYVHPDVVEGTYSSWVADEQPFAVVFDAVATVYKMIGFDEQAAMYRQLVLEQFTELRLSNVQAYGE